MPDRCRTCQHYVSGRTLRYAGVCKLMPRKRSGAPMVISPNGVCYFAVSRYERRPDEHTNG